MITIVVEILRWSASLGRKFIRVVPWLTLAIVGMTLVSQISMLLTSILPLKIVILLGSDGIPHYFPSSFATIDRDFLIVILSVATFGFYMLYLGAERMITFFTRIGTRELLATSRKMALFEGQDDIAKNAYTQFSRTVAGAVFITLAFVMIMFFYDEMAWVIAIYGVFAVLTLWALYTISVSFQEYLRTELASTINLIGGVGFLIVFGFLIADFLLWTPPGVIIAVVSLLLTRQMIVRITGSVTSLSGLEKQRAKLDALFFHGRPFVPSRTGPDRSMWPFLRQQQRDAWVRPLLAELAGEVPKSIQYQWFDLGMPHVATLGVRDAEEGKCCYLVKLFEANRSAAALHEASLVADPPAHLPAPQFVGTTHVDRFHAHVYSWCEGSLPTTQQFQQSAAEHARMKILCAEPPPHLVNRYQRSHVMLWQRLNTSALEWMQVAVDTVEEDTNVERLTRRLPELQALLHELPLALVNPDMTPETLWIPADAGGEPLVMNWSKWTLEPLGAGWPLQPHLLKRLGAAVEQAAVMRGALTDVRPEHAEIAALTYQLEWLANKQRYAYALELLPDILERLDTTESREAG